MKNQPKTQTNKQTKKKEKTKCGGMKSFVGFFKQKLLQKKETK